MESIKLPKLNYSKIRSGVKTGSIIRSKKDKARSRKAKHKKRDSQESL